MRIQTFTIFYVKILVRYVDNRVQMHCIDISALVTQQGKKMAV